MKTLPVRTLGDRVLRRKARAVPLPIKKEIRSLVDVMFETMDEESGVGLAAPQVGKSIRLIVVDTQEEGERLALINPQIIEASEELFEFNEGCLSIPGVEANVLRPKRVRVRGFALDGSQVEIDNDRLLGRVLQHEIDHLDGVLFIDRLEEADRRRILEEWESFTGEEKRVAGAGL